MHKIILEYQKFNQFSLYSSLTPRILNKLCIAMLILFITIFFIIDYNIYAQKDKPVIGIAKIKIIGIETDIKIENMLIGRINLDGKYRAIKVEKEEALEITYLVNGYIQKKGNFHDAYIIVKDYNMDTIVKKFKVDKFYNINKLIMAISKKINEIDFMPDSDVDMGFPKKTKVIIPELYKKYAQRNKFSACCLSCMFPGGGHLYNNNINKAGIFWGVNALIYGGWYITISSSRYYYSSGEEILVFFGLLIAVRVVDMVMAVYDADKINKELKKIEESPETALYLYENIPNNKIVNNNYKIPLYNYHF